MRNHHQNADLGDLRTTRTPWKLLDLLGVGLLLAFVLGMWAMAQHADERDAQRVTAYVRAERERLAMPTKIAEAYERGLNDAVEAMRDTPDGVALAQACFAAGSK